MKRLLNRSIDEKPKPNKKKDIRDIKLNVVGVPTTNVSVNKTSPNNQSNKDYHLFRISIDPTKNHKTRKNQNGSIGSLSKSKENVQIPNTIDKHNKENDPNYKSKKQEKIDSKICFTIPGEKGKPIRIVGSSTRISPTVFEHVPRSPPKNNKKNVPRSSETKLDTKNSSYHQSRKPNSDESLTDNDLGDEKTSNSSSFGSDYTLPYIKNARGIHKEYSVITLDSLLYKPVKISNILPIGKYLKSRLSSSKKEEKVLNKNESTDKSSFYDNQRSNTVLKTSLKNKILKPTSKEKLPDTKEQDTQTLPLKINEPQQQVDMGQSFSNKLNAPRKLSSISEASSLFENDTKPKAREQKLTLKQPATQNPSERNTVYKNIATDNHLQPPSTPPIIRRNVGSGRSNPMSNPYKVQNDTSIVKESTEAKPMANAKNKSINVNTKNKGIDPMSEDKAIDTQSYNDNSRQRSSNYSGLSKDSSNSQENYPLKPYNQTRSPRNQDKPFTLANKNERKSFKKEQSSSPKPVISNKRISSILESGSQTENDEKLKTNKEKISPKPLNLQKRPTDKNDTTVMLTLTTDTKGTANNVLPSLLELQESTVSELPTYSTQVRKEVVKVKDSSSDSSTTLKLPVENDHLQAPQPLQSQAAPFPLKQKTVSKPNKEKQQAVGNYTLNDPNAINKEKNNTYSDSITENVEDQSKENTSKVGKYNNSNKNTPPENKTLNTDFVRNSYKEPKSNRSKMSSLVSSIPKPLFRGSKTSYSTAKKNTNKNVEATQPPTLSKRETTDQETSVNDQNSKGRENNTNKKQYTVEKEVTSLASNLSDKNQPETVEVSLNHEEEKSVLDDKTDLPIPVSNSRSIEIATKDYDRLHSSSEYVSKVSNSASSYSLQKLHHVGVSTSKEMERKPTESQEERPQTSEDRKRADISNAYDDWDQALNVGQRNDNFNSTKDPTLVFPTVANTKKPFAFHYQDTQNTNKESEYLLQSPREVVSVESNYDESKNTQNLLELPENKAYEDKTLPNEKRRKRKSANIRNSMDFDEKNDKLRKSNHEDFPDKNALEQMAYFGNIPDPIYNVFYAPGSPNEAKINGKDNTSSVLSVKPSSGESPKGMLIFVNKKANVPNTFDSSSRSDYFRSSRDTRGSSRDGKGGRDTGQQVKIERSPSGSKVTETYPCGCERIITVNPRNEIKKVEVISAFCEGGSQCVLNHPELMKPMVVGSRLDSDLMARRRGALDGTFPDIEVVADGLISRKPIRARDPLPSMNGAKFTGTLNIKSNKLNGVCNLYLDPALKSFLRNNMDKLKLLLEED